MSEQDVETIPVDPEHPEAEPVVEDDDSPAHPGEAPEVIEGDDADQGDGADDEGDEDAPPEDPAQGAALTEKEIDARYTKLGNENKRHAGRVSEIMADDAGVLIQCPVCMDGIAGWIYPPDVAPLPDEAIARIRQVIGLPDYTNFLDAPDARTCPDCEGRGKGKTGSQVPGREVKDCTRCNGAGWLHIGQQTNGAVEHPSEAPLATGPTVYGQGDPDPRVEALRAEGFTVIPAMAPVNP